MADSVPETSWNRYLCHVHLPWVLPTDDSVGPSEERLGSRLGTHKGLAPGVRSLFEEHFFAVYRDRETTLLGFPSDCWGTLEGLRRAVAPRRRCRSSRTPPGSPSLRSLWRPPRGQVRGGQFRRCLSAVARSPRLGGPRAERVRTRGRVFRPPPRGESLHVLRILARRRGRDAGLSRTRGR